MWNLLKLLLTSVLTSSQIQAAHALSFTEEENQSLTSQMSTSISKEKYKIWMISWKDTGFSHCDLTNVSRENVKTAQNDLFEDFNFMKIPFIYGFKSLNINISISSFTIRDK